MINTDQIQKRGIKRATVAARINGDLKNWLHEYCNGSGITESRLVEALIQSFKNDIDAAETVNKGQ